MLVGEFLADREGVLVDGLAVRQDGEPLRFGELLQLGDGGVSVAGGDRFGVGPVLLEVEEFGERRGVFGNDVDRPLLQFLGVDLAVLHGLDVRVVTGVAQDLRVQLTEHLGLGEAGGTDDERALAALARTGLLALPLVLQALPAAGGEGDGERGHGERRTGLPAEPRGPSRVAVHGASTIRRIRIRIR